MAKDTPDNRHRLIDSEDDGPTLVQPGVDDDVPLAEEPDGDAIAGEATRIDGLDDDRSHTLRDAPRPAGTSSVSHAAINAVTSRFYRGEESWVVDVPDDLRALEWHERYVHDRRLGEGGMGLVELYQDRQIGRRIAVKLLRDGATAHPHHVGRFVREARVQGQLEHPSVVPVYDLGIDPDGRTYFTMKRVRGVTLEEIFMTYEDDPEGYDEAYSRRRLLNAFGQVCLAIDYAHQHGVLHRDLKPGNIMLGDYGEVYVLDWGLARASSEEQAGGETRIDVPLEFEPQTMPGVMMGTPGYMSPEQTRGKLRGLGPPSDVYSLGAILFEMLTLVELHPRTAAGDIVQNTLKGVEARPSYRAPDRNIPFDLEAIVVKATALDPRKRYQTARQLYEAIERFLDGERDDNRRRELAARHAETAWYATTAAGEGGGLESRRVAMREVGRALALDPGNEKAVRTMVQLLSTPLDETPPEVADELDSAQADQRRWIARLATIAYLTLFLYLPFFFWSGIRSYPAMLAFYTLALASAGVSYWVSREMRPSDNAIVGASLVSTVCFACTATFFGPLIVTPTLLAVNTAAFSIHLTGKKRLISVVGALVAMLVVLLLDAVGALPGAYDFTSAGMVVEPGAVGLPRLPTLAFMTVVALGAILTAAITVSRIRDALSDAQRRLYLYTWHLRELVPREAQSKTPAERARKLTFKVSGSR